MQLFTLIALGAVCLISFATCLQYCFRHAEEGSFYVEWIQVFVANLIQMSLALF